MKIKTFLTVLVFLLTVILANLALAVSPNYAVDGLYEHGVFVGAEFGYVDPNNDRIHYFNDNSAFIPSSASKIGSRWYGGYSYNDFYAVELGYDRLIHASSGNSHTYLSGIDSYARFTLPVNIYFSGFGKAGLAYIDQDFKNMSGSTTVYRKDNTRLLLAGALGGSFHVTSRFEVLGAITHMFGRAGIDSITIYSMGAQYTF